MFDGIARILNILFHRERDSVLNIAEYSSLNFYNYIHGQRSKLIYTM